LRDKGGGTGERGSEGAGRDGGWLTEAKQQTQRKATQESRSEKGIADVRSGLDILPRSLALYFTSHPALSYPSASLFHLFLYCMSRAASDSPQSSVVGWGLDSHRNRVRTRTGITIEIEIESDVKIET